MTAGMLVAIIGAVIAGDLSPVRGGSMMMKHNRTLVFATLSLMFAGADVLLGQRMPPDMERGGAAAAGRGAAVSGPRQEVQALQAELSEAQKALNEIESELRLDFESKPEWTEA